jgi:hypothetical protein
MPASTPAKLTPDAVVSAVDYWDSWLAFRRDVERLPGVQAAVWHGDGLVRSIAHGWADTAAVRR